MNTDAKRLTFTPNEIAKVMGFCFAYFLAHLISFFFPDSGQVLMVIWPAGGIGLAAFILSPYKRWPFLVIGFYGAGIVADVLFAHRPLLASVGFMTGNMVESLLCGLLIIKTSKQVVRFERIGEVLALIIATLFVNGMTSCIGAGTAVLCKGASFGNAWFSWYVSDGLGLLIIAPLVITWGRIKEEISVLNTMRMLEFASFVLVWCASVWFCFDPFLKSNPLAPHPYMLIALLAWPAFRFGQYIVSFALFLLSGISILFVLHVPQVAPWGGVALDDRLLSIQLFLAFTAATGFLLAAVYAETKNSRQKILQKDFYLTKAQEMGKIGHFSLDPLTNTVEGSDELFRIFDVDRGQPLFEAFGNAVHPDDTHLILPFIDRAVKEGIPYDVEHRVKHKDGNILYVHAKGEILETLNGKRMVGTVQDITERKLSAEKLEKSEEKFRNLFNNAEVGMFRTRLDGSEVLDFNDRYLAILGRTREETVGQPSQIFWADTKEREEMVKVLNAKGRIDELECRLVKSDGTIIHCITSLRHYRDVNILEGSIMDITDRKHAENAQRNSEERLALALNNAPFPIMIHAEDGKVEMVNISWTELTGYVLHDIPTTEEWTKRAYGEKKEIVQKEITDLYDLAGKKDEGEYRVNTKDGKTLVWDFSSASLGKLSDGRRAVISMARDITERKRIEEELQKSQKLESLGILAGGIAHDFNNLMGGIFGYIDLAYEESTNPKVTQYMSKAITAIDRARGLTQQLLTFAKGGSPIQKIENLFPFVEETTRFALSGSNVICSFTIAKNLWPCSFDRNQIAQVIDNIVINAQQAMPGGGTITVSAGNVVLQDKEDLLLPSGDYVKIAIQDSGIGIPADILPRIFDPFYTTKSQGHGLGLATCYSIIKRHGGKITVDSEPGNGSTFYVYLPASTDGISVQTESATVKHSGSGTVLVMDDEEVMRDTIEDMLKSFGYIVVCKNNGQDAIGWCAEEIRESRKIAGVILDLTIPGGMGGKEAIGPIKNLSPDIPAFVTSGYADSPVMANPEAFGFMASICKPFKKAELAKMLEKYLGNNSEI